MARFPEGLPWVTAIKPPKPERFEPRTRLQHSHAMSHSLAKILVHTVGAKCNIHKNATDAPELWKKKRITTTGPRIVGPQRDHKCILWISCLFCIAPFPPHE